MPVVHEYRDSSGRYMRASIDGTFVTFQMTPAAEKFLGQLGYRDEDKVSWKLIKPLWERKHIYTGESGTEVTAEEFEYSSDHTPDISSREEDLLQEFLNEDQTETEDDKEAAPEDKEGNQQTGDLNRATTPSSGIADSVKRPLRAWTGENLNNEDCRSLLRQAANRDRTEQSIQEFARQTVDIADFEIIDGNPRYTFEHPDVEWLCHDIRSTDQTGDFLHIFRTEEGSEQAIHVTGNDLELWTIQGDAASSSHLDVLYQAIPFLSSFHYRYPDEESGLGEWDFVSKSDHNLPDEAREKLHKLEEEIKAIYENIETSRCITGKVERLRTYYGRIRTAHGNVPVQFRRRQVEYNSVAEGDTVQFVLDEAKGSIWAREIDVYDGEYPPALAPHDSEEENQESEDEEETEIPDKVRAVLEVWEVDIEQFCAQLNSLESVGQDITAIFDSIQRFSASDELQIDSADFTEAGDLTYELGYKDCSLTWVHHIDESTTDFEITIKPSSGPEQYIRIAEGMFTQWQPRLSSDGISPAQRHEFIISQGELVTEVTAAVNSLQGYSMQT